MEGQENRVDNGRTAGYFPNFIPQQTPRSRPHVYIVEEEGGRERDRERDRERQGDRQRERERERERERDYLHIRTGLFNGVSRLVGPSPAAGIPTRRLK